MPRKEKPIEYYVDENGCHICTSHPSGSTKVNGKTEYIHRIIYRERFGDPGEDKGIYRVCGNKLCINPEHMQAMTPSEHRSKYGEKPIEYVVDENGCHICTSHKEKALNGKEVDIHHYVYVTKVGEVPKGKIVAHTCGNKKCINPNHLTVMTREEWAAQKTRPLEFAVDEKTGCHICTSHKPDKSTGYIPLSVNGVKVYAHRYLYEQKFGKIKDGLVVRHKCDNKLCVNIDHFELGTHADNIQDKVKRNRQAKGSKHGLAKLTEEDVREIRKRLAAGDAANYLARLYGVSNKTIVNIKYWRIWKHVTID